MIKIKSIPVQVKATLAYTFSSVLSQGLLFLTTPIFTRLMSTEEMGLVTTYNAWNGILINIVTLSLCSGAFNVAMMEFPQKKDEYLSSMLGLSTTSTVLFFLLYFFFYKGWNNLFTLSTPLMLIMFLGFLFNPAKDLWMSRKRYEYKYIEFLIVSVIVSIITILLSVFSVVYCKNHTDFNLGNVRVIINGLVLCLSSLPFFIYIFYKGKSFFNLKFWKYALIINTPLIFHALSKHILDMSDRLMISNICGKSEVGIYGVLYTVSSISLIIWNAINQALVPYIFQSIKNDKKEKINNITFSILIVYGVVSVGLSLIAPEIVKVLATEEYYQAIYIMPPIAAGIFLTSIYSLFSTVTLYYKKTNYIMYATIMASIINVVLNSIFIRKYGFIAAAYTTLIAYVFLSLFQYVFMCKCNKEKLYNTKKIVILSLLVISSNLLCIPLYRMNVIRYITIMLIGIISISKHKKILNILKQIKK